MIVVPPETFTPNIVFKNPSLKDTGEFRSFEYDCLLSLLGAVSAVLSFLTTGVSRSVLLCRVGEQTQVWFGNTGMVGACGCEEATAVLPVVLSP